MRAFSIGHDGMSRRAESNRFFGSSGATRHHNLHLHAGLRHTSVTDSCSASADALHNLPGAPQTSHFSPSFVPDPSQAGHKFSPVPAVPGSASSPGLRGGCCAIMFSGRGSGA